MIAGLPTQVASLTLYLAIRVDLAWLVYKLTSPEGDDCEIRLTQKERKIRASSNEQGTDMIYLNPDFTALRASKTWKGFLLLQALATICTYIRSVFRVAELNGGFNSHLANDGSAFMVLEGAMISITAIALSSWGHPALGFKGKWEALDYRMFPKNHI